MYYIIIHRNNSQKPKQSHSFHDAEKSPLALCPSSSFSVRETFVLFLRAYKKVKSAFLRAQISVRRNLRKLVSSKKLGLNTLNFKASQKKTRKKTDTTKRYLDSLTPLVRLLKKRRRMGRIKEYFLDKGLTARDIPLAFACVLSLFSSLFSVSSSSSSEIYSIIIIG